MSSPVRNEEARASTFPTMYAPPWARGAGDAGLAAVDKALNASDEFRRTLPPAASLAGSAFGLPTVFMPSMTGRPGTV